MRERIIRQEDYATFLIELCEQDFQKPSNTLIDNCSVNTSKFGKATAEDM